MIDYAGFLDRVIDLGMEAARRDYADDPAKRDGALAGFEACRGREVPGLVDLLDRARRQTEEALRRAQAGEMSMDEYWRANCYEAEIDWTANCVSVLLACAKQPVIVAPTVGAARLVYGILKEGR